MIRSFRDKETERIAKGWFSKRFPADIQERAKALIDRLGSAKSLDEMKRPSSLRFKKLRGRRQGQYSIRVNHQYRICFAWIEGYVINVELTDYH
jgi:proteic killer suppression protein